MSLRFSACVILISAATSCTMYRARVTPEQKIVTQKSADSPTLVADLEVGKDTSRGYDDYHASNIENSLKLSGNMRFQSNSRIAIRYSIGPTEKTESIGLWMLTIGIIPRVQGKRSLVTFELYDRSVRQVLAAYSYRAELEEYTTWLNLVIAPVSGVVETVGDMFESVSAEKQNVHPIDLTVRRFFKDISTDKRIAPLQTLLASGEVLAPQRVIVMPFKGTDGAQLSSDIEDELVERNVRVVVRKTDDVKELLSAQAMEQTGLIATAAAIGKMTGATSLMLGEVKTDKDQISVRARLVDLERAEMLWSHDFVDKVKASRTREMILKEFSKKIAEEMVRQSRR